PIPGTVPPPRGKPPRSPPCPHPHFSAVILAGAPGAPPPTPRTMLCCDPQRVRRAGGRRPPLQGNFCGRYRVRLTRSETLPQVVARAPVGPTMASGRCTPVTAVGGRPAATGQVSARPTTAQGAGGIDGSSA